MKSDRKDIVLKCIVEEFIKTAEPVGSKTLLEKYHLNCSSATIRNTMVELEKEGLIEKTHVSSGRIPSAKGYQYYLDHKSDNELLESVSFDFQKEFKNLLSARSQSIEDVLSKSCHMISELTNTATVFLGQRASEEKLISIQFIKLSEDQALGMFITDSGYIEKKTFLLKNTGLSYEAASKAINILDKRLQGTKVTEVEEKVRSLLPIISETIGNDSGVLLRIFLEAIVSFAEKRFAVYGKKNLLSLPEFAADTRSFLQAIDILDNPDKLERTMTRQDDLGNIQVGFTSSKNGDLAIVTKSINDNDKIAVIGPKRMDYQKILSALEYVAYMLNNYFNGEDQSHALVPVTNLQDNKKSKKGDKHDSRRKTKS